MTFSKKEMRKAYLARLQQLDLNTRMQEQERLASKLYDQPEWLRARTIALTISMPLEFNTAPIILHARHKGKRVVVPRTLPNRQMEFVELKEDTNFVESNFGVLEPEGEQTVDPSDIDLMVVPGVAFTLAGNRLGFGGGYYDRYLSKFPGNTVSMALTTQIAEPGEWPTEEHDVKIQKIINLLEEGD